MSFGKMNTPIKIIQITQSKDSEGFAVFTETVLANIRAYREERYGNKLWANRAVWSAATSLFRFRVIPGIEITTALQIGCGDERFRITSVENVRGRNMYIEVLAEKLEPSAR
jgi:head-tail adaptor